MQCDLKERRAEGIGEVRRLLREGLPVQAYEVTKSRDLGELHEWKDVDEQILAGRLLSPLGAARRSDVLHYMAFRHHPEHAQAALYYAFGYASRFGVLRTLPHMRRALDSLDMDEQTRADLLAFRGYLFGALSDYSVAHADVDAAIAMRPQRAWLWAEKSSVLRMEDRYEEALEAAQHALQLRPIYRVATEQVADLYHLANRDDEAIQILEEAAAKSETSYIVGRLSAYYSELGEVTKALDALDRYEALTPLAEKPIVKWLARRRSDLLYLNGDIAATISLAEATDSGYHKKIAKRLEKGKHAGGKRVKLPVGFVRQHEMTCAPATLTAIAAYWGKEADHLDVAEEICYDGTPGHSERNWAETNGYVVREFRVEWDVAVALIDRGVPFTLTTVETTSAHLQALIGYDAQIGIFLIRDPTHKHFQEFRAKGILKQYRASGPRGMVFVPQEKAELLDGIDFPEAQLYDRMHVLQRALEAHDRPAAVREYQALQEIASGHRMTISAERSLAGYDRDPLKIVAALDKQIALYPKSQGFHLAKLGNMRALWSWHDKCAFVRKQLGKKRFDSVYLRELGELLADDARYYEEALYYFRRALQRRPRDAELLHSMAGVYWDQGKLEEATQLYRFATCLEPTWEFLADSYFKATRFLRRTEEGLEFLRARFERLGGKSSSPAMTLYDAYHTLNRTGEGLDMLEEALELRPDDGGLMLFASGKYSAYNRAERAAQLLEAARDKSARRAWLWEAAEQATRRGELVEAEELWREVIAVQPLAMNAQSSYVRILAESRGLEAALAYLKETCAKFPNNVPMHELYVDWLNDAGPAAAEPVIRHVLEKSPTNNWARRELVINLNRQARTDDALVEAELMIEAAPNESYSYSIAAIVFRAKGDDERAEAALRRALELSVDNDNAVRGLMACAKSDAQRREALQFVAGEFKRQVIFGGALPAYREEAYPILEPDELLESVREIHRERPDLWQSWSVLVDQLKAMGMGAEALAVADGMVEKFPLLPRSYLDLSEVHENLGDTAATIEALQRALEVNPHWTYAMRQLGGAYQKHGDFEKSRDVLEQAVAEDPLDGPNYGYLAEIQWRLDEREAAFESIAKAVKVQPSYRWGWETLGEYALELGKEDEALALAGRLTEMRPQEPKSWDILAEMLGYFDKQEEQLEALDRGIAMRPRESDFYDSKAFVYSRMKRYDEALAACRPEVFGEQPPRQLLGREGWVLWEKGERQEALELMEKLVEAEPDYYWAIKTLCDWFHEEEAHEKALTWAPRLVRLAPEDAIAHGYIAHALMELERESEAIEHLQRAYQLDPTYGFAGHRLFDVQLDADDLEAAEATLEKLLLHLPDRYSLGRKARLAAKRKDREAAFAVHGEICRDEKTSAGTLRWVEKSLCEAGWEKDLLPQYADEVFNHGAGSASADRWVAHALDARQVDLHGKIAQLEAGSAVRHQAWVSYFEVLAQREDKFRKVGSKALREHRAELREKTETWEQVGYYLNSLKRHRENVAWMADWRGRQGLCAWALLQLASSTEAVNGLAAGLPIRRFAIEELAPDQTTDMHRVMVALSVSAERGGEEFERLAREVDHDGLPDFYRFCWELASLVRGVTGDGRRRGFREFRQVISAASERRGKALEVAGSWEEDKVLARAYRFMVRRAFARSLPSLLSMKLLWGLVRSISYPLKK